jgi:hypothetical protein
MKTFFVLVVLGATFFAGHTTARNTQPVKPLDHINNPTEIIHHDAPASEVVASEVLMTGEDLDAIDDIDNNLAQFIKPEYNATSQGEHYDNQYTRNDQESTDTVSKQ